MTEIGLYPGVTMKTSGNTDLPPNSAEIAQVVLWDIGPEKPKAPRRPVAPKGREGDPEYDLAKIEFKEELEEYENALKAWKAAKDDHASWHKRNDGPVELAFWSCDAYDALNRDEQAMNEGRQSQRRYYVSSRTRGHGNVPNRGLPEGIKPGKGQAELERRMREGNADIAAALRSDPVFGQQELRA